MNLSITEIATQFLHLYHEGNHHVLDAHVFMIREYWQGLSSDEKRETLKDIRFAEISYILSLEDQP